MKSLVTGGCGFVGRHLVLRLLELGHEVWIVDNLFAGEHPSKWTNLRGITFIQEDVREFFKKGVVPDFDWVFHFAAVVGGRAVKIEREPMEVAQDISIDAEFFRWACNTKPGRILYASSSSAYPTHLQEKGRAVALAEKDIDFGSTLGVPDATYGWAKLTGEYLAQLAATRYGLCVACVRPFSGYGEDQDEVYPIPAIAARAARKEDPLYIWGSGNQGRDFVYIEDCIDLMLIAVEKITNGSAVNIGTGRLTSFLEVARIFSEIAGYRPKIAAIPEKPEGTHTRFADVAKARSLGWEPKIGLEEGFRRVYEAKRK